MFEAGKGFVRRDSRELDRSAQVSGYESFTRTQKTGIDETGCLIVAARRPTSDELPLGPFSVGLLAASCTQMP